jgi:hypothetical protein
MFKPLKGLPLKPLVKPTPVPAPTPAPTPSSTTQSAQKFAPTPQSPRRLTPDSQKLVQEYQNRLQGYGA